MAKKRGDPGKALNNAEQLFVDHYLVDLDAYAAALAAGYSEQMAKSRSYGWVSGLEKPHVAQAIRKAMAERKERVLASADEVLRELIYSAFADIRDCFDEDGRILKPHELPEKIARAVQSIEIKAQRNDEAGDDYFISTSKIKLNDKLSALEKIGRHLGMFGLNSKYDERDHVSENPDLPTPDSVSSRELAQRLAFLLGKGVR